MVSMRYYILLALYCTISLTACKHIPRGDVALPNRHTFIAQEQLPLPSSVVLSGGKIEKMPETCAERFDLVQKALSQNIDATPPAWVIAVLEHDAQKEQIEEADLEDSTDSADSEDSTRSTGYAPAQDLLARITLEGDGVPKDSAKAFSLALDAARQGYTKSQILVASLYTIGHGTAQNPEQAFDWLREAAHTTPHSLDALQNQITAMAMLGDAYRQGFGVAKDNEEALLWTYKAAHAGDLRACWWLGLHYYYGWGTPRDMTAAYVWCRLGQNYSVENATENASFIAALYDALSADERRKVEEFLI